MASTRPQVAPAAGACCSMPGPRARAETIRGHVAVARALICPRAMAVDVRGGMGCGRPHMRPQSAHRAPG